VIVAHVAGLPVEELVLPLASVASLSLMAARAFVMARLRRFHRLSTPQKPTPEVGSAGVGL
jgi:hypothetical protein